MDSRFPKAYAAWTKDAELRFNSTSGGIFSELAYSVLARGGFICGARYKESNAIEHDIVRSKEGVKKLRQSKYAQSSMGNIYRKVKSLLISQKLVAFAGTPCQVAGLKSYLGKQYENLITFDFICRGVNSPKAYRCWISEIEKNEGSTVTNVWFKYKVGGWKTSPTRTKVDFLDGHEKIYVQDENLFMIGYLGPNLYIRKSCGDCRFKGMKRCSDITLADFWGIAPELDDDCGTSLVLVNTPKGEKVWNSIYDKLEVYEQDIAHIFSKNPMFNQSADINPQSSMFLQEVNECNFSQLVREYVKQPLYKKNLLRLKRYIPSPVKEMIRKCCEAVRQTSFVQPDPHGTKMTDDKLAGIPRLYSNKEDCCGCTACFAICPKQAITMVEDNEGFKYPQIDAQKCVDCQQCVRVCPIQRADN